MASEIEMIEARGRRQKATLDWARRSFGERAMNPKERALRVLEEALELAQAEGVELELVDKLARHVYGKPPGDPAQEIGGVAVTLLCYCERKGLSNEAEEVREFRRVLGLPIEYLQKRHAAKEAAGITNMDGPDGKPRIPTP